MGLLTMRCSASSWSSFFRLSFAFIVASLGFFGPLLFNTHVHGQVCMTEKEREDLASVIKSISTLNEITKTTEKLSSQIKEENAKLKLDLATIQKELKLVKNTLATSPSQGASGLGQSRNERSTDDESDNAVEVSTEDTSVEPEPKKSWDPSTVDGRLSIMEAISRKILPTTCTDYAAMGIDESGYYLVDPDGPGVGEPPIKVYCKFQNSTGVTIVTHDLMDKIVNVGQCTKPGCFSNNITYTATEKQIIALIDISDSCMQKIKYDCFTAPLAAIGNVNYAWWVDRTGNRNYYWSGRYTDQHTCACGIAGNCSAQPDLRCNCDASAPEYFTDEGILTDPRSLPVQSLVFGGLKYASQQANFTLGGLECSGKRAMETSESCDALRKSGHTASGNYIIKPRGDHHFWVVACNMDRDARDPEFQVELDVLRDHSTSQASGFSPTVIFDAYITKDTALNGHKVLSYDAFAVNLGGGMDLASGTFSPPIAGTYMFTFTGFDRQKTGAHVSIRKNGAMMARAFEGAVDWGSVSMVTLMTLKTGDRVDTTLHGELASNSERWVHFTGHLLSPT